MLGYLVENIYIYLVFWDQVFRQSVCIPMGTNCVPVFIFIWSRLCSETVTALNFLKKEKKYCCVLQPYKQMYRWCIINQQSLFVHVIYPIEFEIKDSTESDIFASYLDSVLGIDSNGKLTTTLYAKMMTYFAIIKFSFYIVLTTNKKLDVAELNESRLKS
jgi:hypothetical protein